MTDLIAMTKDGETLEVARPCVADHQRVGWVVVETPPPDHATDSDAAPKRGRKKAETTQ